MVEYTSTDLKWYGIQNNAAIVQSMAVGSGYKMRKNDVNNSPTVQYISHFVLECLAKTFSFAFPPQHMYTENNEDSREESFHTDESVSKLKC